MVWEPMFWKVMEVAEMVVRKVVRAVRVRDGSIFGAGLVFSDIYILDEKMWWYRVFGSDALDVSVSS